MRQDTVGNEINEAFHQLFETHDDLYFIGEDILDPYGGAFKISRGLSEKWPDRVLPTPVSEESIVGLCGGMALRGLQPVGEIMFGDFMGLAFDQFLNYISKFRSMYDEKVRCPVVIRTPMGGKRGYGPTHSQTLEKHFVGIPGLRVRAVSHLHNIFEFYKETVVDSSEPTLIVENKCMYGWEPRSFDQHDFDELLVTSSYQDSEVPTIYSRFTETDRTDVSLVTYGGMVKDALKAARNVLIERDLIVEVVVIGSLSPLPLDDVLDSVRKSGKLLTVEEGTRELCIGSELVSSVVEDAWSLLDAPVLRVAAKNSIVPAANELEDHVLPGPQEIEDSLLEIAQK